MTFGTPIYDDNGAIKNAIVYCHGSLGNYASVKKLAPFLGKNDAFDENKYFFICISALGSPGSCSPSTTDLKNKFPKYSINDVVNFQKKFLSEKFNIEHVLGMIGNSMGGFVSLTSAINFPDYADFIICGVSSYNMLQSRSTLLTRQRHCMSLLKRQMEVCVMRFPFLIR